MLPRSPSLTALSRERNSLMKIDEQHVLPCDFVVGHMRFGKGVKLETVRKAAERWLKIATDAYFKPDPKKIVEIDRMLADLHNDIEFFKNLPDDETEAKD